MYAPVTMQQLGEAAQAVLDIQEGRRPRIPRSVLSPKAAWPVTEPAPEPAKPRRTDEENLALRAWASARHRASPARQQLLTLQHHPLIYPVFRRQAKRALQVNREGAMVTELEQLVRHIAARQDSYTRYRHAWPCAA